MRKKLNDIDKKVKITFTLNPALAKIINELPNRSKYIENVIYRDLKNNNMINKDIML